MARTMATATAKPAPIFIPTVHLIEISSLDIGNRPCDPRVRCALLFALLEDSRFRVRSGFVPAAQTTVLQQLRPVQNNQTVVGHRFQQVVRMPVNVGSEFCIL